MSKIQIVEDAKIVCEKVVTTEKVVFAINGAVVWEKQYSIPGPVDPPITPPITPGQFTSIIEGSKKCNTPLVGGIGGYGFYDKNTPGPTSVKSNGKTYFLLDPAWLPGKWKTVGKRLTVMWINMSLTPNSQTSLYEIDSLDNGKLVGGPKGGTQDSFNFSYKVGVRWLVEVDTTACPSGYSLSIKWPY